MRDVRAAVSGGAEQEVYPCLLNLPEVALTLRPLPVLLCSTLLRPANKAGCAELLFLGKPLVMLGVKRVSVATGTAQAITHARKA